MLTEKDFYKLIMKIEFEDSTHRNDYYRDIINAAKEAGAKFDPELVELPDLITDIVYTNISSTYCVRTKTELSREQANEIIRRCRVVDRVKQEIGRYELVLTKFVLEILDGPV